MDFLTNITNKAGGQEMRAKASEANYVLFDFKPQDLQEKELIEKASSHLIKYQIGEQGICAGFSLALSLRRYLPNAFGDISFKRCMLDICLTMAGYAACSYVGMEIALDNTRNLRKSLILQRHDGYLTHLEEMQQEFPAIYRTQRDVFTEVLKDEEYDEWVKNSSDYFQK